MQSRSDAEATPGPPVDLEQIARLIELVPIPVTVLDDSGMSPLVNQAYCESLGLERAVVMSRALEDALHPDDVEKAEEVIQRSIDEGMAEADLRLIDAAGRPLSIHWNLRHDVDSGLVVVTASDRTTERQRLADAQRRARTDTLTGLLSRAGLMDQLQEHHRARPGGGVVVALFDIDGFKSINDTMGHQAGDLILRIVARRLRGAVPDDAAIGRLGGDEFVVISTSAAASVPAVARSIQSAFSSPMDVAGRRVDVSASVGLCRSSGAESVDDLLRNADIAVYEVKRGGGNAWLLASDELVDAWHTSRQVERELAQALGTGRFVPWFQPIVDPIDGRIERYETLMRWVEPDGSVRAASTFLDAAVASGLLPAMSCEVRREAVHLAGGNGGVAIALNVSADELLADGFVPEFLALMEVGGLPPERVMVEVTEQTALHNIDRAASVLNALRSAGFTIALDDFGSGYSSLTYMTRLPIDVVKLDGGFLQAASEGEQGRTMLRAITEFLAHIDLVTVIEGVETDQCHRLVLDLGLDLAQGWFYGAPVPGAALPTIDRPTFRRA